MGGGGHWFHAVCDLTIASREHGRFKQTDADVGSFDAGYGSAYYAKQIGQKLAREVFFLAEEYSAQRAYEMGAVNRVVDHDDLEREAIGMARTILTKSPTAIRMLKYAFNAADDGMVGMQLFASETTRLAYGTDEAVEGRDSVSSEAGVTIGRASRLPLLDSADGGEQSVTQNRSTTIRTSAPRGAHDEAEARRGKRTARRAEGPPRRRSRRRSRRRAGGGRRASRLRSRRHGRRAHDIRINRRTENPSCCRVRR